MKRRWDPYTALRRLRLRAFLLATLWPVIFALAIAAGEFDGRLWKIALGPMRMGEAFFGAHQGAGPVVFTAICAGWINGWLFLCRNRSLRVICVSTGVLFWLSAGCLANLP